MSLNKLRGICADIGSIYWPNAQNSGSRRAAGAVTVLQPKLARHIRAPTRVCSIGSAIASRGVSAAEPVLVPEPVKDMLSRMVLSLGGAVILFQDLCDDAGIGFFLSLSKGWDALRDTGAGSPAAPSRPTSCAPRPGAGRTPGMPPRCSSPPPSPPCGHEHTLPLRTSVAPHLGSDMTL